MEFNLLKTVAGTAGRRIAAAVAGGVVSLLIYMAFDAVRGQNDGSVLMAPELTQAEYDALKAYCSQSQPPIHSSEADGAAIDVATRLMCEQLEAEPGRIIVDE